LVNRIFGCNGEVDVVDTSRRRRRWAPTPESKTVQEGGSKGAAPKSTSGPVDLGRRRGNSSTKGVEMAAAEELEEAVLFY
jgi:hypothetical protein